MYALHPYQSEYMQFFPTQDQFFSCAWDIMLMASYWKKENYKQVQKLIVLILLDYTCVFGQVLESQGVWLPVPIIFHNDCCLHKLNIFKSFACSRNVMHKCSWTATPLFAACLYIYYLILLSYVTLRKALQPRSEFCSQNLLCNLHLQSTHKIYCRQ